MNIVVGDYIRTKDGIHQVFKINEKATIWKYLCDKESTGEWDGSYTYKTIKEESISKVSSKIKGLILAGDYVNGEKIEDFDGELGIPIYDDGDYFMRSVIAYTPLNKIEIKSIVTKEQFEKIKYEVVE